MRTIIFIFALIALPAKAQMTFFNDSLGLPMGTANQMGNTTLYSDAKGLPLGSSQNLGSITIFSDAKGLPLGTANTPQPILPYSAPQGISPPGPFFPSSPRGM
jgi:hypothetical protein